MTRRSQNRDWVDGLTSPAPALLDEPKPAAGRWTTRDSSLDLAAGATVEEMDTVPAEFYDLFGRPA